MAKIVLLGRYLFAVAVAASGLRQVFSGEFVRLAPGFPGWIPWPAIWARLIGVFMVLIGTAILVGRRKRLAAIVLASLIFLLFLSLQLPLAISNPLVGYRWTNPAKTMALCGGAILLAGIQFDAETGGRPAALRPMGRLVFAGPAFLGIFLFICGFQHFDYADFVDTLVPVWIPPSPRFWTWFAGAALVAGGVGVVLPRTARLAAFLSGLMVFLWVLLLHIPRAIQLKSLFELDGVFEALAISGVALLVAGTRQAAGPPKPPSATEP